MEELTIPWSTPTLKTVRSLVRDAIRGNLPGADASIPNSVLRVMSDAMGALCHLTLQYVDWLARQLMPDTAETEWLDRHGDIWLTNADGSTGRKLPTLAQGTVTFTGTTGAVVPIGTQLTYGTNVSYETIELEVTIGAGPSEGTVRALDPGTIGNRIDGDTLGVSVPPVNVDAAATVIRVDGGTDEETDDELRLRVLERIRAPPMGGDAEDYINWALRVPGVTRAWSYPLEQGIGTVTVRFMMDDLRAENDGFPLPDDVETVRNYLNTVRPVAVKDFFAEAPIPYPIDVHISYLNVDNQATHGAIEESLLDEFYVRQKPGQTWYRAWTDEGVMSAANVVAYDLVGDDQAMPSSGYMPVLGEITYGYG
jgi:uncharacterized phage protein gp47/JayE